ncbi:PIN domain-containing protein [Candidatus Symbiopectobacterium sp. NZEC135]|uniref:PIN domain-containing protein n=1 Tax=Candidatus Symbiopectobacterium sp. NZEC135 TaxID=2820471 RepID=UPI00222705B2|nr:PIN domain-containing protein [Candidatus Symbiopectobacterium sp. NZEC135]
MAEKYTAILIDTSVYEQYGLRMEKGLLGKLTQFSRVETKLLLPDVIYSEVRKHLDVKIKASKVSLEKALDEASDHLFFEGSELNCARKSLIEGKEIEGLGKSRIDKFAKATAALMLETGEYVSVPELLRSYFTSKPPFAETGKKKSEFPDAIILMAVQSWAEQNQENVLAVARDEDWARFCEHSKFIHYETDLAKALAYFNEETAPYALTDNLERALNEGVAQKFIDDIAEELNSALSNFAPYQEANSYLYWEPGGSSGGFKHFEFSDNRFSVIDKDENRVVLEAL